MNVISMSKGWAFVPHAALHDRDEDGGRSSTIEFDRKHFHLHTVLSIFLYFHVTGCISAVGIMDFRNPIATSAKTFSPSGLGNRAQHAWPSNANDVPYLTSRPYRLVVLQHGPLGRSGC